MNTAPVDRVREPRSRLLEERGFRVRQLAQLDEDHADPVTDLARAEVEVVLRAAAASVLADIDQALRRIRAGDYGRCDGCGDTISPHRLNVLPMTPWCGECRAPRPVARSSPGTTT